MIKYYMGATAIVLSFAATQAIAQDNENTDLTGTSTLTTRLDDIQSDVSDDLASGQDANRFGNPEFRPGLSGSASLGYSGQSGNTDSQDLNVGARLRFASGQFVQNIGLAVEYSEEDGSPTSQDVFGVYDGNYYFNDSLYGFVLGRIESDGLARLSTDIKQDAFLGIGPGYRIFNTEQMTWRVQAGVGMSYLEDGTGVKTEEPGGIVSSRFYYAFNDRFFATNDTDVLKTESSLRVNNEFGINMKVTDAMATRVSYMTEYNDTRAIQSDNTLGVSLVVGF
jgi:putative salt-induced outer membrane protein